MIIAIDGPAGSGKSSTAKAVAERLGITFLDTGAMYRAITLKCLRGGIKAADTDALAAAAAAADISFTGQPENVRVILDGEDVTEAIRSDAVTRNVSDYCTPAAVRSHLVRQQRKIAEGRSVVCEGRDIGTVVFPDADLKFFLVASVEERARRRQRDFLQMGVSKSLGELAAEIAERDRKDSTRQVSPLRRAADAEEVDTTGMTLDEQVAYIMKKTIAFVQGRGGAKKEQAAS
jgi:cytidylate kinase